MRTMLAMPLQPLRHRAFYALEALLAAFQVNFCWSFAQYPAVIQSILIHLT